jgi:hypothetical protein
MLRLAAVVLFFFTSFVGGCKERHAAPGAESRASGGHGSAGSPGDAARRAAPDNAPGSPNEAGPAIPPTFATLKLVLTGTRPPCNAADCHGPGGPNPLQYQLNDDEKLYATLTQHVSVDCGNIPVVTPGNPARSAIVKVLKGPCSSKVPQMPNGCTPAANNCLPAEYVAAIERWIELGAPKN